MDCCICMPDFNLWMENTICNVCYDSAKIMMAFLNDLDGDGHRKDAATATATTKTPPLKGMRCVFEKMKEMLGREKEKVAFLEGSAALREELHTDILVKAGDGQPVPAHRAVLASKSEIFKIMLLADDCKAAPTCGIISIPELTHRELKHLIEFLYSGELPPAEQEPFSTVLSLLIAADKYDIPFLRKSCERRVLADLCAGNALDVLDTAQRCSSMELKERAMQVVVEQAAEVVFSPEFEAFAARNEELCREIKRARAQARARVNVKLFGNILNRRLDSLMTCKELDASHDVDRVEPLR